MFIDGKYRENITCQKCRHRHPADILCHEAKRLAELAKENRQIFSKHTSEEDMRFAYKLKALTNLSISRFDVFGLQLITEAWVLCGSDVARADEIPDGRKQRISELYDAMFK